MWLFELALASVVDQIYCNLAPHTFVIAIQLFPSDCAIVHFFYLGILLLLLFHDDDDDD